MENGKSRNLTSSTASSGQDLALTYQANPKGSLAMQTHDESNAKHCAQKKRRICKPGTYAVALSSSSQSMQIPLHTSSAAHQANRFLSCSGDPTLLYPIKCSDEMENGFTVHVLSHVVQSSPDLVLVFS